MPEPSNPHDTNAVEVRYQGRRIGYMSAALAVVYQPIIQRLQQGSEEVWVNGKIEEESEGGSRASFQIPWPDILTNWAAAPVAGRGSVALERVEVTLKRLDDYQAEIAGVLAGRTDAEVAGKMVSEVTPTGKYKGHTLIRFTVDGVTIGLLPAQFRMDNEAFFDEVEAGNANIRVHIVHFEDSNHYWAKARLP